VRSDIGFSNNEDNNKIISITLP